MNEKQLTRIKISGYKSIKECDLEMRKNNFENKYKELGSKFNDKYNERVREHLKNEVRKRFYSVLRDRVS